MRTSLLQKQTETVAELPPIKYVKGKDFQTPDYVLIHVDTDKLDRDWSKEKDFYIPRGGPSAISDRRERFQKWLADNPNTPVEAPFVSWNDYLKSVAFSDGRHRFSVLRDMGYPAVGVTIAREDLKNFKPLMKTGASVQYNRADRSKLSKDFGYSKYRNREEELSKLTFEVSSSFRAGETTVAIEAWTPDRQQNPYSPNKLPVGYIEIGPSGRGGYYVWDVNIELDWRGTGLGQMLYDRAIEEAKKLGATRLWSSDDMQPDARKAWKRLSQRYPVKKYRGRWFIELNRSKAAASGALPTWDAFVKHFGGFENLVRVELGDEEVLLDQSEAETDEQAWEMAQEELKAKYDDFVGFHQTHQFPKTVWRVISLPQGLETLRETGVGIYWSWDVDAAESHEGGGKYAKNNWLLEASIQAKDIDWFYTLLANLQYMTGEDECEIRLKRGSKIKLVSYCPVHPGNVNSWSENPTVVNKMVTAAISPSDRTLYHGTNEREEFDTLKPTGGDPVVWLGELDTAKDIYSRTIRGGRERVFEVKLKPDAKIANLLDENLPITRKIQRYFLLHVGSSIYDHPWADVMNYAAFHRHDYALIRMLREDGFDGAIVMDRGKPRGAPSRDHHSVALFNMDAIESQQEMKTSATTVTYPKKKAPRAYHFKPLSFEQFCEAQGFSDANLDEDDLYWKEEEYASNVEHFGTLDFPVTVYRSLELPPGKSINFDEAGVYWSWVEDSAQPYFGGSSMWAPGTAKKGEFVMIKAQVMRPNDVDWQGTLRANFIDPDENELRVLPGAQLKLVGVQRGNEFVYKPVPGEMTITASVQLPNLKDVLAWGGGLSLGELVDWTLVEKESKQRAGGDAAWVALTDAAREEWENEVGKEYLHRNWDVTCQRLRSLQFPLTVYRAIDEPLSALNLSYEYYDTEAPRGSSNAKGVGLYWSDSEASSYIQTQVGPKAVILRGEVNTEAVNWLITAFVNLVAPDELEIRLKSGTNVKITGWRQKNKKEWQQPPEKMRTVTAAAVWYHGTTPERARAIQVEGFNNPYNYFTTRKDVALGWGVRKARVENSKQVALVLVTPFKANTLDRANPDVSVTDKAVPASAVRGIEVYSTKDVAEAISSHTPLPSVIASGESTEPYIDAHRSGGRVIIDMLWVPPSQRGEGVGTRYYEEWEKTIPPDVTRIEAWAADTEGEGNSDRFWESLGFEYKFEGEEDKLDYESAHWMWKGANGHPTPKRITGSMKTAATHPVEVSNATGHVRGWMIGTKNGLDGWAEACELENVDQFLDNLPSDESYATIGHIEVNPDSRQTGEGKRLLAEYITKVRETGATVLLLLANTDQEQLPGFNLVQWYESQGFEILDYNTLGHPIMSKELGAHAVISSHKTPAMSDTTFPALLDDDRNENLPGEGTNGYANLPEKVEGVEVMPSVESLLGLNKKPPVLKAATPAEVALPPDFEQFCKAHGGFAKLFSEIADYGSSDWEQHSEFFDPQEQEEFDALPDSEKEKVMERRAYEDWEQRYNQIRLQHSNWSWPMKVWRCVTLKNIKELKTKGVGIYWSYVESSAEAHWGVGGGTPYTLEAQITEDAVDWEATVYANLHPSIGNLENEICLKEGAPVKILQWQGPGWQTWHRPLPNWRRVTATVSEADVASATYPRLNTLRRDSLEEAFGVPIPTTLTVYHAGPEDIHPGVFVTTDEKYAREFLEPGEKIWTKTNVPLAAFQAYGDGRVVVKNRHTGHYGVELIYNPKKTAGANINLYHGTCYENAKSLCDNGWAPRASSSGGNMGQSQYLYLSTGQEDALWFAQEKGCDTLVEVRNIPLDYLKVDPEDGTHDTLEEELDGGKYKLPGKAVLTQPLPASHFHILRGTKNAGAGDRNAYVPRENAESPALHRDPSFEAQEDPPAPPGVVVPPLKMGGKKKGIPESK